jgi:retron-type reverse transcriptase
VVETDIADCFEAVPKDRLIQAVKERVCDQSVLALLRVVLGAGVMADGVVRRSMTGTPQGGPLSPLLSQRVSAPARPGVGHTRAWGPGPLLR